MNKRQLWMGIGIGMIVGAILLQLMIVIPSSNDAPLAQVQDKLDPAKVYSQDEFNQELELRVKEALDKQAKVSPVPTAPATSPPEIEKQTVIYVAYRTTTEEVVKMLNSSELITDSDAFMNEMVKRKLTGKIRTGVHLFKGTPTFDEIIDNLVKPQT